MTEVLEQLVLDLEIEGTMEVSGTGKRLTKGEAGLRKAMPAGPARLLANLVRRGLDPGDLKAAAAIVLALDARPARDEATHERRRAA